MSLVFQQAADTTTIALNSTTSASGALNRPSGNNFAMVACVLNHDDAEPAFVRFGASDVVATEANAVPIAVGERAFLMVPAGATHAAVIAPATATGDVFITLGYTSNAL
jgi:hypothetical protein